jgi:phosphoribosyl-ATP pyrophosphohydrolase
MSDDTLIRLAKMVAARRSSSGEKSYTRQLLDGGAEKCARKFGEEAVELVIAGVSGPAEAVTGEAADVLYHLVVLLEARGQSLADVYSLLEGRMRQSGLQEKASRGAS